MSQKVPILLNCVAAVAGALGQYLYKKGGEKIAQAGSALNLYVISGVFMFCIVMALFVVSYKMGGRISVVYPFYATTFLWGTLIGIGFDGEPWHPALGVGIALVLAGTAVIAWFSGSAT